MPSSQDPKYAFVTGASAGIGKSLTKELISRGYTVFAGARRLEMMEDLSALGAHTLKIDVTSQESIESTFNTIVGVTGGKLDVLFNNAGKSCPYPALEVTLSQARECFDVNFFSIVLINQVFAPLLIKAKGKIVMIASSAALIPYPFLSIYAASKAAVSSYSNVFRLEMQAFDVQVTSIITGSVQTTMVKETTIFSEDSVFNSPAGREYVANTAKIIEDSSPMPSDTYAKKVCHDVLDSYSLRAAYYRGKSVSIIWFMTTFLPYSLVETIFIKILGFDKLIAAFKQKQHSE